MDKRPPRPLLDAGLLPEPAALLDGVNETVWIEVIQKMDEVYNDLLQYEVALEQNNAALEESHRFIASILASMSDILVVCDRQGRIEEVNPAFSRYTGKSEGQLKGTPVFELFADPQSQSRARGFFQGRGDGAQDVELPLGAEDGGTVPVSFNWTPRHSGTGKLIGMVVTGRPVGELRRAYQELRQTHDDLKRTQQQLLQSEKMASLGRLVAGVAHELNNPISFVLGNVLALKRYTGRLETYLAAIHAKDQDPTPELADLRRELRIDRILEDLPPLIEGMIEGAERTRDIVDGLKRFSALDRESSESFNLTEVVDRALRWIARSAPADFQVRTELPPQMFLQGSPGQMQQVVMNLIHNALQATAGHPAPRLEILAEVRPEEISLSFHDNGPGIPDEALGRLFDPFFTTKPVGEGTGLGLSISYGIIERHGGRIIASNHADGGAVFRLTLPRDRGAPVPDLPSGAGKGPFS